MSGRSELTVCVFYAGLPPRVASAGTFCAARVARPEQKASSIMTPQHLIQVQHLLPASAQTLAELIGLPATLKLVSELGGRTWSCGKGPRTPRENAPDSLAQLIGPHEAELLARHFAGDADVHIPLCKVALRELRDREIRAEFDSLTIGQQRSARQAVAELAGRYGIASRHVWRLLKQTDKTAPVRPLN